MRDPDGFCLEVATPRGFVTDLGIGAQQWPQLLWHGERHDKMLHGEQLARLLGQPVLGLLALAVWAVLIATNQLLRNKTGLTEKKPANLNAILLLTRSFPDKISEMVDLLTHTGPFKGFGCQVQTRLQLSGGSR